jgi:release factor glutamine methyltransferase
LSTADVPAVPTVPDLLADATRQLAAAGVDSPRVDAELLLAAAAGVPRSRLLTLRSLPAEVRGRYAAWIARRRDREPVQHIIGTAPFRRIELAVGPGVFVPRPETELLVDAVLPHLRPLAAPLVFDLCAGTGALALAIADEVPGATVVAVEASPPAFDWLVRNSADRGSVVTLLGDVRDPALLREYAERADAVVANPPYVPDDVAVEAEVRADPHEAIFAGPDGMEILPAVAQRAAELLRPGGVFAVEHHDTQGEAVAQLLTRDGRWSDVADHADLAGRPRFATARRG